MTQSNDRLLLLQVTYDLHQLDSSFLPSLRDTLVASLETFANGPKTIVVQLSLALSGLAIQFPAWQDVAVSTMIEGLGRNPTTVPVLLEFLTVLPEELNGNAKIPVNVSIQRLHKLIFIYLRHSRMTISEKARISY